MGLMSTPKETAADDLAQRMAVFLGGGLAGGGAQSRHLGGDAASRKWPEPAAGSNTFSFRSVEGAGELARMTATRALVVVAREPEAPGGTGRDQGYQLQQGLVDRAQLLGVHVAVVDAAEGPAPPEECEPADSGASGDVGEAEDIAQGGKQAGVSGYGEGNVPSSALLIRTFFDMRQCS
jgi:hypothetical protein